LFVCYSPLNKIFTICHTLFVGILYKNLTYFTIQKPMWGFRAQTVSVLDFFLFSRSPFSGNPIIPKRFWKMIGFYTEH